jgi:hypothetical protein
VLEADFSEPNIRKPFKSIPLWVRVKKLYTLDWFSIFCIFEGSGFIFKPALNYLNIPL